MGKFISLKLSLLVAFALISTQRLESLPVKVQNNNQTCVKLPDIVKLTIFQYFAKADFSNESVNKMLAKYTALPELAKPQGLFVTLSYQGKTRACWGSLYPQYDNLAKATIYTTLNALTKEYRYPPIKKSESKDLKAQVTLIESVDPIASINQQNPLKDGLFIRSGGKTAVILPGEAKDAYYQLVMCKLKADIKKNDPYQMYRLITTIYD
jgi:AMMECR1 domain-containing protein